MDGTTMHAGTIVPESCLHVASREAECHLLSTTMFPKNIKEPIIARTSYSYEVVRDKVCVPDGIPLTTTKPPTTVTLYPLPVTAVVPFQTFFPLAVTVYH